MTRVREKLDWRFSTFETHTTKTLVLLLTSEETSGPSDDVIIFSQP